MARMVFSPERKRIRKTDRWKLVKEIKTMIEGEVRINVRATGDAVRVIPKTDALGVITKVEVFVVPKEPVPDQK